MRFDESPDLFGVGIGMGTIGHVSCGICGNIYNEGMGADNDEEGESVLVTNFAGMEVAECCFEKIEAEVSARMKDIVPWYRRIIESSKDKIQAAENLLSGLETNSPD